MNFNKTIQMLIFNGNPNGTIMCELSNWNGRVYKISRNELGEFSKRDDSKNTGIYFLFGKNDDNSDTVYIGEAEELLKRIKQHLNDKTYWTDVIAVTSMSNSLNKAHVKHLENCFHHLAQESGRIEITNATIPTKSSISEFDNATLQEFISNTKLLVNALGFKIFDSIEETTLKSENKNIVFKIEAARGANAKGVIVSDGFAVLKGSRIANTTTPTFPSSNSKRREDLLDKKIVNENYEFIKDWVFSSPSLAASIVMGRSANGLTEWKTEDGRILKSIAE